MVLNFCTESTWSIRGHACLFRTTAAQAVMVLISLVLLCVLTGIFNGSSGEPNNWICDSKTRLPDPGIASFMAADFLFHP
jgi:hypothetical protein